MLAMLLGSFLIAQPPMAPFELESAKPRADLTAAFVRTSGWTGSDCAYSISLGPKRSLWLFGDTWIGKVENGRREGARMINNSAAWQQRDDLTKLEFFWNENKDGPFALLKPDRKDEWYWPGDGAIIDGALYLFVHVIRHKEQGAPGFQFDWFADELLRIANPNDPPTKWRIEHRHLSNDFKWGVACAADAEFLYAYSLFNAKQRPLEAPVAVARIAHATLKKFDKLDWEVLNSSGRWVSKLSEAAPIIRDGASEMTVQRIRGIDGFVMTYMPLGLSTDIVVRHAAKPEGPWSAPLKVYQCPKQEKGVFMYAAKGHAELGTKDGQMIVTYCRNIGDLSEHVKRPTLYAPQVIEVNLHIK